jgi:hypothetical protein
MYRSIVRREAVQSIELQRTNMIAALFSNPNWDGEENTSKRQEYITELNKRFNEAIEAIYHGPKKEPDIDWDNPFYAAAKRGLERTRQKFGLTGQTAEEVLETSTEEDQARIKARLEARGSMDQTT